MQQAVVLHNYGDATLLCQGLLGFLGHPIHHLYLTLSVKSSLSQGVFKPFSRLPQAQDANSTAIFFGVLFHSLLLPYSAVTIADRTFKAKLIAHYCRYVAHSPDNLSHSPSLILAIWAWLPFRELPTILLTLFVPIVVELF
jgi:hypothetical protein